MTKINSNGDSQLRLDDIVDYLASDAGQPAILEIKESLSKQGVSFEKVIGPGMIQGGGPQDVFERLVSRGLEGSFLLPSESTAALPNSVAYALAHAADENGMVSEAKVRDLLGGKAEKLYALLSKELDGGSRDLPTARRRTKYKWMPDQMIDMVAKSAAPDHVSEHMPILGEISKMAGGETTLKHIEKMAAVQHLFPSTRGLFESLRDNGLDADNTLILGKNYSADEDLLYRMRSEGWQMPTLALTRLVTSAPDGTEREVSPIGGYLQQLFEGTDPSDPPQAKFLLLDEGGKMMKALHSNPELAQFAHLCVAVEQTDHGIQVIEEMKAQGIELKCPVVSMARSEAKKVAEAPMIGESVAFSIDAALLDVHPDLKIEPKEAAVIGYGAVGKATADSLRDRGYKVFVYDIDPDKMAQAEAEGCTIGERNDVLAHGHLLVSATGKTTITPDDYDAFLPNRAVLVNAASGNHELGADQLDSAGQFLTSDPQEKIDTNGYRHTSFNGLDLKLGDYAGSEQMFSRVVRADNGNERLLLRSGYVINMVEDIPPEYIQLTRGLLLASCLQAAQLDDLTPRLVDVDQNMQRFIVSRVSKHLKKQGHDLMHPNFRKALKSQKD